MGTGHDLAVPPTRAFSLCRLRAAVGLIGAVRGPGGLPGGHRGSMLPLSSVSKGY